MGLLTIPTTIYKVTERTTSTPSTRHCWWCRGHKLAGFNWSVPLLPYGLLVTASVTNGPRNVRTLHGNKTWWRIRNSFLTLSPSSLSHPTATKKRQGQHFLSCICMWQHLLWRKKGTFLSTFILLNALTLQ